MRFDSLTEADDLSVLLALNNELQHFASPLDNAGMHTLVAMGFAAPATPARDAFLLALDQDAPYPNANFAWFKARYPRFVYIDRIMVGPSAQGTGVAVALYEALFEKSRAAGHSLVTCEVNSSPPNPRSERFHARMGFDEAGFGTLPGRTVRYLVKTL